ncbi:hypothetical protein M231_06481 [Tremella mesenterica]|uniref:Uncharacterized protein n=1 Tax=Tremella mesenterica TaxID=5217 RepID=A0A4Q1BDH9_TREME|nr:hypothetical protein M231_06481 [Tremella mesenterica]
MEALSVVRSKPSDISLTEYLLRLRIQIRLRLTPTHDGSNPYAHVEPDEYLSAVLRFCQFDNTNGATTSVEGGMTVMGYINNNRLSKQPSNSSPLTIYLASFSSLSSIPHSQPELQSLSSSSTSSST